jgi:soluble lytic murein transglycosylase-like protein
LTVACFSIGVVVCGISLAHAQSPAPSLCNGQLSPAQQERFRMLNQACRAAPASATSEWPRSWRWGATAAEADALVATEPVRVPRDSLRSGPDGSDRPQEAQRPSARESAHLQLYSAPGVVSARMGPPAVAATRARGPVAGSARAQGGIGPTSSVQGKHGIAKPSINARALALAPQVDAVARRHDIDPLLLHAVAHVESRHNPGAVSHAGARGVMQVMPATAARFGVAQSGALHDAPTNLEVSAAYLKTLQRRFGTNLPLVLAAYNAGEGAVERYGRRIPPFAETQSYVRQVLAKYALLTEAAQQRPSRQP